MASRILAHVAGDQAELLAESERVRDERPRAQPSFNDVKDAALAMFDGSTGRGIPVAEEPEVGPPQGHQRHDPILLSDQLVDRDRQVGEGAPEVPDIEFHGFRAAERQRLVRETLALGRDQVLNS